MALKKSVNQAEEPKSKADMRFRVRWNYRQRPTLFFRAETAVVSAMATFPLDDKFTATATPYRDGEGFVMKGTLFYNGRPKETFVAYGPTIPAAEDAARANAEEIWRRLKAARPGSKPKL